MDMKSIDLNLLVAFDAMVEHRNVTRAGQAIGLSQPAMSAAVSRLRRLFEDALFVRAGAEMRPTPRAAELAAPVRRVLDTVRADILQRTMFNPATTDRTFTIITPDIGEINFLPRLLAHFTTEAPLARLRAISLPRGAAAEALESGAADLAVGYFPDLHKPGFFQQKLFDNPHVCIVRTGHPALGPRITLRQYLGAAHAVVRPEGREHVFEQFMQQRGLQRRVVLELSHFMSLIAVVESSDLIATVPLDLARLCLRYADIRIVETPVKSPVIAVHQFWHRRVHQDDSNEWLRGATYPLLRLGQPALTSAKRGPG